MPFTFSHPAAVLPLALIRRKWISLTALAIGSLTPDFEYFFRMRIFSTYSHSWGGVFSFDLPVGLLLSFVFHGVVRDPLMNNLPRFLQRRFQRYRLLNWPQYFISNWIGVVICLVIGAASHILWDGFTHRTGYFVRMMPVLQDNVNFIGRQ